MVGGGGPKSGAEITKAGQGNAAAQDGIPAHGWDIIFIIQRAN